jgi:sulfur-oxidizing protein SoxY
MIRNLYAAALALGLCAAIAASPMAGIGRVHAAEPDIKNPLNDGETWAELKYDVFGDTPILDGSALFDMDAPYRAHDAAVVPVRLIQAGASAARITKLTLIVDENPAPVVAEFEFGPSMGTVDLETRVRVDQYSNIRAIAETADGKLWMVGRYVKGAGGCSAPALKDMETAMSSAGKMRMKVFDVVAETASATTVRPKTEGRRQAQIMIRHPNYSGLQRNQVTQLFIPAFFVNEMSVFLGDEHLIHMSGGISISEDPTFRFSYDDNGATSFSVEATDTDGGTFGKTFPIKPSGSAS